VEFLGWQLTTNSSGFKIISSSAKSWGGKAGQAPMQGYEKHSQQDLKQKNQLSGLSWFFEGE
jgi:hypothetical protein